MKNYLLLLFLLTITLSFSGFSQIRTPVVKHHKKVQLKKVTESTNIFDEVLMIDSNGTVKKVNRFDFIDSVSLPTPSFIKKTIVEIPDSPDSLSSSNYTVNHNLNITSYISVDILLEKTLPYDTSGAGEDYTVDAAERIEQAAGFISLSTNSIEMAGYDFSNTPSEKLIITYIE